MLSLSNCFLLNVAFEEDIIGKLNESDHKSPAAAEVDEDTEALLLLHLDGILSIGTLGHPHPVLLPDHCSEVVEPELGLPEKEVATVEKPPARITLSPSAIEMRGAKIEQSVDVVIDYAEEKRVAEVPLLKEDRERKERTTLADLLATEVAAAVDGEASVAGAPKRAVSLLKFSTVSASTVKSRDMAKEKLEKKNKVYELDSSHSSAPIKTIRRMITRMVKKKIHPEAPAPALAEKAGGVTVKGEDPLRLSHRSGPSGCGEAA